MTAFCFLFLRRMTFCRFKVDGWSRSMDVTPDDGWLWSDTGGVFKGNDCSLNTTHLRFDLILSMVSGPLSAIGEPPSPPSGRQYLRFRLSLLLELVADEAPDAFVSLSTAEFGFVISRLLVQDFSRSFSSPPFEDTLKSCSRVRSSQLRPFSFSQERFLVRVDTSHGLPSISQKRWLSLMNGKRILRLFKLSQLSRTDCLQRLTGNSLWNSSSGSSGGDVCMVKYNGLSTSIEVLMWS